MIDPTIVINIEREDHSKWSEARSNEIRRGGKCCEESNVSK